MEKKERQILSRAVKVLFGKISVQPASFFPVYLLCFCIDSLLTLLVTKRVEEFCPQQAILCNTSCVLQFNSILRQCQIPQGKGSVPGHCPHSHPPKHTHFSRQTQTQVISCASDQSAVDQRFQQSPPWIWLIF